PRAEPRGILVQNQFLVHPPIPLILVHTQFLVHPPIPLILVHNQFLVHPPIPLILVQSLPLISFTFFASNRCDPNPIIAKLTPTTHTPVQPAIPHAWAASQEPKDPPIK